jgi:hypothetical protein
MLGQPGRREQRTTICRARGLGLTPGNFLATAQCGLYVMSDNRYYVKFWKHLGYHTSPFFTRRFSFSGTS